jgi:hypothetical protein
MCWRHGKTGELEDDVMAYQIKCKSCGADTWAGNVVDLFTDCANSQGRFVCSKCKGVDTFIHRISALQEGPDEFWERWIKGVIRIDSGYATYSPYIFLTSDTEDGPITGLHFNYYKDTRSQAGGRLKHGHGPGGAPVLGTDDLFTILRHLVASGIISKGKIHEFANSL